MKALAMVAAAVVAAITPLIITGQTLTAANWINVVLVAIGAATVYISGNLADDPVWQYTKAILAGLAAAGTLVVSFIGDGSFSGTEIAQIIVAVLGGIATYWVPNPVSTSPGKHEATP